MLAVGVTSNDIIFIPNIVKIKWFRHWKGYKHTRACMHALTEIGNLTNLLLLLNDSRPKIKAVFWFYEWLCKITPLLYVECLIFWWKWSVMCVMLKLWKNLWTLGKTFNFFVLCHATYFPFLGKNCVVVNLHAVYVSCSFTFWTSGPNTVGRHH
jgi:hypothetical protein